MPSDNNEIDTCVYTDRLIIPDIIRLLEEGHTVTLKLHGRSMRPFLEDNRDKALLAKASNPKVGDVVLAEIETGVYVLHRIIGLSNNHVTLRGDGNLSEEHCMTKDIKGYAIGFYRKGRTTIDKTDGMKWLLYSQFWTYAFPIRRYLLAIYRVLPTRNSKHI